MAEPRFCAAARLPAAQQHGLTGQGSPIPPRCGLTGCRLPFPSRTPLQPPSSYGPVLSPMNKVHGGGINKLPSVNQLVGQPAQHSSSSAPSLGPMGKVLPRRAARAEGPVRPRAPCRGSGQSPRLGRCLTELFALAWPLAGPGMLNSHPMQPNGEMNGGHSSQSMVSGSHCTPPPPYNPDPSLVR